METATSVLLGKDFVHIINLLVDRFEGLVPEEHRRLLPPEPTKRKGQRRGQHQGKRQWGQRSVHRRRCRAGKAQDPGRRAAVQLPGRQRSPPGPAPSGSTLPETGAAALSHLPRTSAAQWQVGVDSPAQIPTRITTQLTLFVCLLGPLTAPCTPLRTRK